MILEQVFADYGTHWWQSTRPVTAEKAASIIRFGFGGKYKANGAINHSNANQRLRDLTRTNLGYLKVSKSSLETRLRCQILARGKHAV
jgi:hypothetical protein